MLIPVHMYMYLKLIDIQILFWSYMYSLLNLCLWQKFKPNFYGKQILTLFFYCVLYHGIICSILYILLYTVTCCYMKMRLEESKSGLVER